MSLLTFCCRSVPRQRSVWITLTMVVSMWPLPQIAMHEWVEALGLPSPQSRILVEVMPDGKLLRHLKDGLTL